MRRHLWLGLGLALLAVAALAGEAAAPPAVSFAAWELVVDSAAEPLAAWQVTVTYDPARVTIVGVEGPEFYDERGLEGGRIVLAAFVADDEEARAGANRVARLHLRLEGAAPDLAAELAVAARPGGERIPAAVSLRPAAGGEEGAEGENE